MADFIRARSDEQKEQRMQEIKDTVNLLFEEKPYHEITLTTIAEQMGWTRANLYKYVSTKEEIFLELAADTRDNYYEALIAAIPDGCDYSKEVFSEVWSGILNAHRDHLHYCDILSTIIETNVSIDRLAAFKKRYYEKVYEVRELLIKNFGIAEDTAYLIILNVHYHAVGINSLIRWNPLVSKALEKENIKPPKVDFRKNLQEFILMNLNTYCK